MPSPGTQQQVVDFPTCPACILNTYSVIEQKKVSNYAGKLDGNSKGNEPVKGMKGMFH